MNVFTSDVPDDTKLDIVETLRPLKWKRDLSTVHSKLIQCGWKLFRIGEDVDIVYDRDIYIHRLKSYVIKIQKSGMPQTQREWQIWKQWKGTIVGDYLASIYWQGYLAGHFSIVMEKLVVTSDLGFYCYGSHDDYDDDDYMKHALVEIANLLIHILHVSEPQIGHTKNGIWKVYDYGF